MPKPLVVARSVARIYQSGNASVDAVRDVTCVVMPGQRISVTGPSGSGKSTLLHLLGGLDAPSCGDIAWPGLGARAELRPKKVVDIFQGPSLLEPLSVIENVKLPLLLTGMTSQAAEISAEAMLDRFGVGSLAQKLPEEISGGQAQRVSIARALVVRPELVLADEPTGQLDVVTAASVFAMILQIVQEISAAIVVSTHDIRLAAQLEEAWTMRDGVLDTGQEAKMHAVTVASAMVEAQPR